MKNFITLCILLCVTHAMADVVRSPIHSVEEVDGSYLIKFENGRVAFSSAHEKGMKLGANLLSKGDIVEAKVDDKQNLISIQTVGTKAENLLSVEEVEPPVYEPTVLPSYAAATELFNRLNPNYKRASECSNRAHVWANEEFKKNGTKSMKVFAFFTASYINRVRFKWWFHVAPVFVVQEGGNQERRVFDYMFNRRPLTIKEWTDQFVFSKRPCKPTTKFSEYDVNPQTEDCYLMVDSMYYWMPGDLQANEQGKYKTDFIQSELNAAYAEAF